MNDWTKEYVKDVVGQKIFYYAVSTMKTNVHPVYDEAVVKIFENPVALDVIASQPDWETKHNQFGMEQTSTLELFLQARDLLDKELTPAEGDFFTYGDAVFEVAAFYNTNNIFGQEEYESGYKLIGKLARPGAFDPKVFFGPTKDDKNFENAGVQKSFEQQRGLPENREGATGDVRQVRERLGDEMAPVALDTGPRRVALDPDGKPGGTTFYDE